MTKKLLAFTVIVTIVLVSCTEKDPFPLSNASFDIAADAPEVYHPVKFENLSTNAASYRWDFGDGSAISTEIAPTHTYTESRSFSVSLTAITEDDQESTETQVIDIGERYLTGMYIININRLDGDGKPWDNDGSGPDVLMQLGPVNFESEEEFEGFFVDSLNVGQFQTPIGINTTDLLSPNYKLTNEEFFILLEEVDTVNNEPKYTTMIELQFNPVLVKGESITEIKRADGTGDLTIPFVVFDEYQFFLEFEIK